MSKLILCINCLEINNFGDPKCSNCKEPIKLNNEKEILEACDKIVFFAYQNRNTIQRFVDQSKGKAPVPKALQIPHNEIFTFIAMSVASGLTFEGVRYVVVKIWKSLKKKNIKLKSRVSRNDGYNPDEELLQKFLNDDNELKKFIKFIEEYRNGMEGVHEEILIETTFLDERVIEKNRQILNELLSNVEEEMNNENLSNDEKEI